MADTAPVPEGYHSVTPWIITPDTAGVMEFVAEAFGGTPCGGYAEREDGRVQHAEMRIGDSVVMFFDAKPGWPPTPALTRVYLPDAEAAFARALKAGGVAVTELCAHAFGDTIGIVRDPLGNVWWVQQRVEDVTPEELGRRLADPTYLARMRTAEDDLDQELSARGR